MNKVKRLFTLALSSVMLNCSAYAMDKVNIFSLNDPRPIDTAVLFANALSTCCKNAPRGSVVPNENVGSSKYSDHQFFVRTPQGDFVMNNLVLNHFRNEYQTREFLDLHPGSYPFSEDESPIGLDFLQKQLERTLHQCPVNSLILATSTYCKVCSAYKQLNVGIVYDPSSSNMMGGNSYIIIRDGSHHMIIKFDSEGKCAILPEAFSSNFKFLKGSILYFTQNISYYGLAPDIYLKCDTSLGGLWKFMDDYKMSGNAMLPSDFYGSGDKWK